MNWAKATEVNLIGLRTLVIGDVHGCPNELESLLTFLIEQENLKKEDRVIFIGDYINKGNEAREAVDMLIAFKKDFPETIFLRGNHEDMLLGYLGFENSYGDIFLRNAGEKTLKSYGIKANLSAEDTKAKFPKDHLNFFLNLHSYLISEKFVFVHAGLNPINDLRKQTVRDIFWIRNEFIQNIHKFDKTVIFGHTPFKDAWIDLPYKIGIDTGLVYGNRLSCIDLGRKKIFQVKAGGNEVLTQELPWI